jgi:hypothetical protein
VATVFAINHHSRTATLFVERIMMAGSRTSALGGFVAASTVLIALSLPAAAEGQELWHGVTVGMSVHDVQKFFPTAKPIQEQDPSRPGWVALLRADSVEADGLREAATFTFKDARLINVVTTSGGRQNPGTITGEDVRRSLSGLKGKYGHPLRCKQEAEGDLFLACFWRVHGLFIGYMGRADPQPMVLTFVHPWEETDASLLR